MTLKFHGEPVSFIEPNQTERIKLQSTLKLRRGPEPDHSLKRGRIMHSLRKATRPTGIGGNCYPTCFKGPLPRRHPIPYVLLGLFLSKFCFSHLLSRALSNNAA